MPQRAVLLFAGGLDSLLAAYVLQQQAIDVQLLHIQTPSGCAAHNIEQAAQSLHLPLHQWPAGSDYVSQLAAPPQLGHLPADCCCGCRVHLLRLGGQFCREIQADFLATGEVLGQRPAERSRLTLASSAQQAGVHDILLRPLSAKLLPYTPMELSGLVQRERLFSFSGRGRHAQLKQARRWQLPHIPPPLLECPLRQRALSHKLRWLLSQSTPPTAWHFSLLPIGRHFCLPTNATAVVGRHAAENAQLQHHFAQPQAPPCLLLEPQHFTGPTVLLTGPTLHPHHLTLVSGLLHRYSRPSSTDRWATVQPTASLNSPHSWPDTTPIVSHLEANQLTSLG